MGVKAVQYYYHSKGPAGSLSQLITKKSQKNANNSSATEHQQGETFKEKGWIKRHSQSRCRTMGSTKQHHGSKDDDTTVSSNSNNSSNEGSGNNSSNEGSNTGTNPPLGQPSRRSKNRHKKRKEQKQQQKDTIPEEELLNPDSSPFAKGVRFAALVLLFVIGAVLGINVIPIFLPHTRNFSKTIQSRFSDRSLKVFPAVAKDLIKRPSDALSEASKPAKHLVEILSSTTITVYGDEEETYTNGQDSKSNPPYYFSDATRTHSSTAPAHRPGPVLCSDGYTFGYDNWNSLRAAIHNLNSDEYGLNNLYDSLRANNNNIADDLYYESFGLGEDLANIVYAESYDPFTICPGATLRGRNFRGGGIYVNRPDVLIECDGCTLDLAGTHFRFGSEAKGVTIRGLSLMGASTSSLLFHEDGAEVTFEDCTWINNSGLKDDGAVADLNSTSSVSFYRCEISDSKQRPLRFGSSNAFVGSSLIIRNA